MERKDFLKKGLLSGALLGSSLLPLASPADNSTEKNHSDNTAGSPGEKDKIVIERPMPGKPHRGKVLLAIQSHCDDIPLFAGGTVAKLLDEGYTGYLLRTSDDNYDRNYEGNFLDTMNVAKKFGMVKAYSFDYPNHRMENIPIQDLKARLIFLFRLLKVDTIISWDPWEHYEENPDHTVTAIAVEAARWMAGSADYPEFLDAGIQPHIVKERYYFSRDPQRVNRIVDISNYIDKKVEVSMVIKSQGPAGSNEGAKLRARLAKEGKYLPILGNDDDTANFNYVKHFVFDIDSRRLNFTTESNKKIGERYGLEWAEQFHYVSDYPYPGEEDQLEKYIRENAVRR